MKLIVIHGPKSSGKTGSIKMAVKKLGVDFSSSAVADIQCITKIRVGVSNLLVGIGSAGDAADAIRANLLFFKDHPLDFVICASSVPRAGKPLIDAFAILHDAEKVEIETQHVKASSIQNEIDRIASKIVDEVRK